MFLIFLSTNSLIFLFLAVVRIQCIRFSRWVSVLRSLVMISLLGSVRKMVYVSLQTS